MRLGWKTTTSCYVLTGLVTLLPSQISYWATACQLYPSKKSLTGRYYRCRLLIHTALKHQSWLFGGEVFAQIAKSLVGIVSVAAELSYKLLRHRIGSPIKEAELVQWQQIWSQCNQKDSISVRTK